MNLDSKKWLASLKDDMELKKMLGKYEFKFLLKIEEKFLLFNIEKKGVYCFENITMDNVWDFTINIPEKAWMKFISSNPPPFHNTLQAMIANVNNVTIEGNRLVWAQSIEMLERIFFLVRMNEPQSDSGDYDFAPETIKGHYVTLKGLDSPYHVYYEESGQGQPVIFLHTAGSDSRQYKFLLGNRELQKKWHMYAFDLPFHGKSEPPDNWWKESYQLTTDMYVNWIMAFMNVLNIGGDKKPIISGFSMGGAIVLYLAEKYGELFKAVISLEGGFGREGRKVTWTNHPQVHAGSFLESWVNGLMSPKSPEYYRRLVLWQYSQGGNGVYQGDTYFYSHDFPRLAKKIGKANCPLWILCGEYDYSCTPEMSEEAARKMGGEFVLMKGIGHFPMTEHPAKFLDSFKPILEKATT